MSFSDQETRLGRIGRYQLLELIASGRMGVVYLARLSGAVGFEKLLAIKVLLPEYSANRQFVEKFLSARERTAGLKHPNICEVYELGSDDGRHFVVMEYLGGLSMSEIGRLPPTDHLAHLRLTGSIVAQAAKGLHHLHQSGITHRDVSPANIFVTENGVAKILDIGIAEARSVDLGESATAAYMSPEQLGSGPTDSRSDVFALGIVLYEALTSTRLFVRNSAELTAQSILTDTIEDPCARRPEVPRALGDVVTRALQRDPSQRFATALELSDAIEAALPGGEMSPAEIKDVLGDRFARQLERGANMVSRATTSTFSPGSPQTSTQIAPASSRWGLVVMFLLVLAGAGAAAFFGLR